MPWGVSSRLHVSGSNDHDDHDDHNEHHKYNDNDDNDYDYDEHDDHDHSYLWRRCGESGERRVRRCR